jgi:dipeptidyl aminopeptidase/acylaminoacyl peptidase
MLVFASALAASTPHDEALKAEGYIRPPAAIERSVTADWQSHVRPGAMSPDGARFVSIHSGGMPPLQRMGKPWLNLAGLQIDPETMRGRENTARSDSAAAIHSMTGGAKVELRLPEPMGISGLRWTEDGRQVVFVGHTASGDFLYAADASNGQARKAFPRRLKTTLVDGFEWLFDGMKAAVVLEPQNAAAPNLSPLGNPLVRVSTDAKEGLRTHADLLKDPDEAALFTHLTTGQLAVVDLANGRAQNVGEPRQYRSVNAGPGGQGYLATVITTPYTYLFPWSSFASRELILDKDGKEVLELSSRLPADAPKPKEEKKEEEEPRRGLAWRPDGAGLTYLQKSKKDKDGKQTDRLMLWKAPFGKDDTEVVWESEKEIGSVTFLPSVNGGVITRTDGGQTVWSLLREWGGEEKELMKFRGADFYTSPGSLETKPGAKGGRVARISADGMSLYLGGVRYDKDPDKVAPKGFLDRLSTEDGKTTRLFESSADKFETADPLDDEASRLMISWQSPTEPQNYDLMEGGTRTRLTDNKDMTPELTQGRFERVQVTRADGFKFYVEVWLPRYALDGRDRPAMFWHYPTEFTDQATYDRGQRTFNKNAFQTPSSSNIRHLNQLGYVAVFPDCPITGPSTEANNTFVSQLRNNMYAVIDELDRRQLIDRRMLAIGGHSYGAFGTANAMIHTPFFRAGIAGAGNYNRTLTPFGFQRESRQLWQGREVYTSMSAMLHAENMTGAMLMYHGAEDQNMGTSPINSLRMFDALEALGKTTALYMYPYEDHGQRGLETRLDMWARWVAWLEKHARLPQD